MLTPVPFIQALVCLTFLSLLAWAAASDARRYLIPNRISVALLLLYPAYGLTLPPAAAVASAGVGLLVFAAGAALFAMRAMGGGDVKLMAAVALWAGPAHVIEFITMTTMAGGLLAASLLTPARALFPAAAALIEGPEARPRVPYGIAIAVGGLFVASQLFSRT